MTEYEQVKEISGKAIYQHGPCSYGFDRFVKIYGFHEPITDFAEFMENVENYDWYDFLTENEFIRVKKEEVTYPYLGEFVSGRIVFFTGPDTGYTIYKPRLVDNEDYLHHSVGWAERVAEKVKITDYKTERI